MFCKHHCLWGAARAHTHDVAAASLTSLVLPPYGAWLLRAAAAAAAIMRAGGASWFRTTAVVPTTTGWLALLLESKSCSGRLATQCCTISCARHAANSASTIA